MKPSIRVYPHQLIKLSVNNYVLQMVCLPYDRSLTYSYKWERKNKQLPVNVWYTNPEKLYINSLKPDDSGEYRCIISNSTGQIASDYSLVIAKGLTHHIIAIVEHGDVYNCIYIIVLNHWHRKSLKSMKNNCLNSYSYEEKIESGVHGIFST